MSAGRNAMTRHLGAALALAAWTLAPAVAAAQSREWTTNRYDAQRTGWVRSDPRISKESIEDGTFQFLWKAAFDNEARQLDALTEPVLQDFLVGYRGFKSLAFVGGSADRLFAIDTDLAKPYWRTDLTYAVATGGQPPSSWECPGGLLAAPTRRTSLAPSLFTASGSRRGPRAKSAVGEPGKGAAILAEMAARAARQGSGDAPPPPARPAAAAGRVPPVPFGGVDPIYAMASDGLLRTLRVTDGASIAPPVVFLPPNTRPTALLWADGMAYTTTSHGCGAAPNAVWALDTTSEAKTVARWDTGGPDIAGASGVTLGTDGTVYVALRRHVGPNVSSGNPPPPRYASSVVALDRLTLTVKGSFIAEGADFNASPVAFRHKERDLVVVSGNDGRLYLLDAASIGGADQKTPLHVTPAYTAAGAGGALATWEDGETRWVLAPAVGAPPEGLAFASNGAAPHGSVVAFKLADRDGSVTLEPAWRSGDLVAPLGPIVVNGLVFAASSGEYSAPEAPRRSPEGGGGITAAERARRSTPAELFALDAATGARLWSSGTTITSFARAGLSAGGGQVYLVTYDNTLYAFGIPLEH